MEIFGMSAGLIALIVGGLLLAGVFKMRNRKQVGVALLVIGFLMGGLSGLSLPSMTTQSASNGEVSVKLSNGFANASSTVDYLNVDKDAMTIYSTDASMADGDEYKFNATIERTDISKASGITITCTVPDKEISGVTADNLAEKTNGQIDLDIQDSGNHESDNTVSYELGFTEGTVRQTVEIAFDQEETYSDGMTDMSDYVVVSCDAEGTPFSLTVYQNS